MYQCLKTGWLKAVEMYSPTVLERGRPNQGVGRASLPLKAPGKTPSLSLPASGGGHPSRAPWLTAVTVHLSVYRHKQFSLCVCCHLAFSSYGNSNHWMRAHPNDLILTTSAAHPNDLICKGPISIKVALAGTRVRTRMYLLGRRNSTHNPTLSQFISIWLCWLPSRVDEVSLRYSAPPLPWASSLPGMSPFSAPPCKGHCFNFKHILATSFLILLTIESIA